MRVEILYSLLIATFTTGIHALTNPCMLMRCARCSMCDNGRCVYDPTQLDCPNPCASVLCAVGQRCVVVGTQAQCVQTTQAGKLNGTLNACARVRCTACHTCRVTAIGAARCVEDHSSSQCCKQTTVNCFIDPCTRKNTVCPLAAECVSNYCGGCNAVYYDRFLNRLDINSTRCKNNSMQTTRARRASQRLSIDILLK